MAGANVFLRLGDIEGSSTDERHGREIELTALSWGLHSPAGPAFGGGAGATGRVQIDAVTARAPTSVASPRLMQACAEGRHFPDAVLSVQRAGERPFDVLVVTLGDVSVSAYGLSIATDGGSEDQLSLLFGTIQLRYDDGQRRVEAGVDVARNVRL